MYDKPTVGDGYSHGIGGGWHCLKEKLWGSDFAECAIRALCQMG